MKFERVVTHVAVFSKGDIDRIEDTLVNIYSDIEISINVLSPAHNPALSRARENVKVLRGEFISMLRKIEEMDGEYVDD